MLLFLAPNLMARKRNLISISMSHSFIHIKDSYIQNYTHLYLVHDATKTDRTQCKHQMICLEFMHARFNCLHHLFHLNITPYVPYYLLL